jgi:hypothetical protein
MNFDAIDAACFKSKITILFLFLKSGVVTKQQLQKRSLEMKKEQGIDIYPLEKINQIEKFDKVYNRYVNFIYARKLQQKTLNDDNIKASKILAKISDRHFNEILTKYLVK